MYRILQYKDVMELQDEETQKRFSLIKKLSKDFTVENKSALELDELLTEQMELQQAEPTQKASKNAASKQQTTRQSGIEDSFSELFEALKNNAPVNIHQGKVSFRDLDENVQKLLTALPQTIIYELPDVKTNAFNKPDIKAFQQIIDDVLLGNNVFLVGGAGSGKTFMAENLISKLALGRKHITINCSQWTSPTEIIGGQTMDGYVEGKLIEAWQHGYVLILDELPKIDPNTAGLFNDALAKTKITDAMIFNARKESFVKHKNFACVATGNIYPDKESMTYGANNKQDLSLLDRFSGSVYFIEKNPALEKEILQNNMVWSICDKMRTAIEELKYEAQLSLRFMQNARDAYNLEMLRIKDKGKNGIKADEGKTFKSAVDSYLSTFTSVQEKNIKDKINYKEIFSDYDYREFDKNKIAY